MEKIKLPNSNKIIKLDISNKLTEIYGVNGVGKTTISNHFSKDKNSFVFNEQYIYDNVYITDGIIKSTIGQKKNSGRVFISKSYKILNDKLQLSYDFKRKIVNKKSYTDLIRENLLQIDKKYREVILNNLKYIDRICFSWEKELMDLKNNEIQNIDIENILDNLTMKFINETIDKDILTNECLNLESKKLNLKYNKEELESDISYIENSQLIENYNNFVTKYSLLSYNKDNFLYKNFINLIEEYNDSLKEKENFEKTLVSISTLLKKLKIKEPNYNDPNDQLFKWIKSGNLVHKDFEAQDKLCLYCGNQNLQNILEKEFNLIFKNKILQKGEEIINKTNKLISDYEQLNKFLIINKSYNKIPNLKEIINGLNKIFANNNPFENFIKERIKNGQPININEFSNLWVNILEIKKNKLNLSNLSFYILDNVLSQIFKNLKLLIQDNILKLIIDKLVNNEKSELKIIEKEISEIFNDLNHMQLNPFNFKLKFNIAKGTAKSQEPELLITDDKGAELVGILSTGQRNNLALIYFVSQAIKKIKNKEINKIIIDDPVDGGDFYSYFLIKSFIKHYFAKEEIKIIILTHNFDYLLIQLIGTDRIIDKVENKKLIDNIDIMKLTNNGKIIKINKEEINSDNKTIYFKLTEYLSKEANNEPLLIASWIIWTRKIIEELLVNNVKLNNGIYISDVEPFASISFSINDKIKEYLTKKYKSFISGNVSYKDMIIASKNAWNLIFKDNNYLENLSGLINKIDENIFNGSFDEKEYLYSYEDCNSDNLIDIAIKSAKLIILGGRELKNLTKKDKIIIDIANYLKHSGNAVSRPIIALEFNSILEKEINK